MPRARHVIRNMPLRGGLATAGQQGTIPETALWKAENMTAGLDGVLSKRPGLWQWGQEIKQPSNASNLSFYDTFTDLEAWSFDSADSHVEAVSSNNKLQVSMSPDTAASYVTYGRSVQGSEADSTGSDWSVRFTAQASNMQDDSWFVVRGRASSTDDAIAFRITSTAVEYQTGDDTWATLYEYDFQDAGVTTFEFQVDADDEATLFINEVEVASFAVSSMYADSMVEGTYLEFDFQILEDDGDSSTTQQWTLMIGDLMMEASIDDPFVAQRLGAGTDFKTIIGGPSVRRNLVIATDNFVYRDTDLNKFWTPLLAIDGEYVSFSQFGDDLLIFVGDSTVNGTVYRWGGTGVPEALGDAPDVRFGTEHRTRLWAAGDKMFPLRLYYTASRDPNVWFAPESDEDGQESSDEVLDAGYVQIPGKRGDEIVAVYGEFYGSCIVATNRGIWRITGSSPLSFTIENISQDTGAASQAGLTRLGNDLWMAGRQGITTIQTVQQFGDMMAAMPSAPIADLWSPGVGSGIKVDQYQMFRSSMAWNPTLSLMYYAFAQQGASDVSSIYVYNPVTQGWYGPWKSNTTFVSSVEIASPIAQVVMHGTSDGKIGMTDPNYLADFGESYTMLFESPYLSGRDIDPSLTHQTKTWKALRLFVQQRGDWDVNIRWQTDDGTYVERVESQNLYDLPRLGVDWRLNVDPDGRVHSNQMIGIIEMPLDVRGRYLKFDVSTADDYVGEDLVIQGYEVELLADGPEQEKD